MPVIPANLRARRGRPYDWVYSAHGASVDKSGLILKWEHLDQEGLALVSPTDGRTVWETTVVPEPHIEVVTDDVVLVGVGAGGPSDDHHQKPPLRTVAIRRADRSHAVGEPGSPRGRRRETVVGMVPVPDSTKWTVSTSELDHPGKFSSCDDDGGTLIVCAGRDDISDAERGTAAPRLPGRLEELTADQATFITRDGVEVLR